MVYDIKKEHLVYDDYLWDHYDAEDSRVSGDIDNTKFNRSQGCEVLYIINRLMLEWGLEGKSAAQKIERMIRNRLPYNVTAQIDVKIWVKQNWKFY